MNDRLRVTSRWLLSALLLAGLFNGCSTSREPSAEHAFIVYWPPPASGDGLRLAVKDLIDIKGVVTTAGSEYVAKTTPPASHDAKCLELARKRNVKIVGKTNLTELGLGVSGMNRYFGSPKNPLNRSRVPGGSSSGSAVAVATGMADVAFGTDTAGSIRVPAAFCGVFGLKTTFGLIPLEGVFPLSPENLDTVGPTAKDIPRLVQGMDLLQEGFAARYRKAVAANPSARSIKIGRLYIKGTDPAIDKALDDALAAAQFRVIKIDESFAEKWSEAQKHGQTVAVVDGWLNDGKYADKKGITATTKVAIGVGRQSYANAYAEALKNQAQWQATLRQVFKKVDLIAVPTIQKFPPRIPLFGRSALLESQILAMQNTAAVNFAGNPALALPIPVKSRAFPYASLQLVGPRFSEAELLNAGRLLESTR
jgi:amidase